MPEKEQKANIHPTAIIEEGAVIGPNVQVEPYAIVKKNVVLEANVVIKSHSYIDGHTTIGEGTIVWPSTSIGTQTQDLKYNGEKTYVKIGKNCHIREFVTINSSTQEDSVVSLGDNCLVMAYCHIAHNCKLGNNVIMSNSATLAGHVIVEDYAIIGGFAPIHQYVRVGAYSMIGGMSRVGHDIPPFTIGGGIPFKLGGLNVVGLKRHGFSLKTRNILSKVFKLFYRSDLRLNEAMERVQNEVEMIPEVMQWLDFCKKASNRGIMGFQALT